jgi:hypothetical protein
LASLKRRLFKDLTLTAKKLKAMVPALENIKVRTIQDACKKKLELPSRKMTKKPFFSDCMKNQRLEFASQ